MAHEDGRIFDSGDVVADLECVGVSYQENEENGRYNFSYTFKLKSEMDAARKAEADFKKAEAKRLKEAAEAEEEQRKAEEAEELAHRNEN